MCIDVLDNECVVDIDYVLNELYLYELLDSNIEVNPKDIKKNIKSIKNKIGGIT